jgi:hypothetical protein
VFIYSESEVRTQLEYHVYFISAVCFGAFTWLFFLLTFDVKKDPKTKVIENKQNLLGEIEETMPT